MIAPGSGSLVDSQQAMNSLLKNFIKVMQTVGVTGRNALLLIDYMLVGRGIEIRILLSHGSHSGSSIYLLKGIQFSMQSSGMIIDTRGFRLFMKASNSICCSLTSTSSPCSI